MVMVQKYAVQTCLKKTENVQNKLAKGVRSIKLGIAP